MRTGATLMYRFLMVDDEEIVRRGFRSKINWAGLGFEFLEPCENGEQAIEALEALRPDVVMTDIAMPRMDGLGVADYAARHHPETVIVILSGYDEFEYAQRAIRANVFEYILKPVTSRDLTGLLGRLKDRLDSRARSREEVRAVELRAEAAAAVLKERALVDLVTGPRGALPVGRVQEALGFSPDGLGCCVLVVDAGGGTAAGGPGLAARMSTILADVAGAQRRALGFSPGEGRYAVLVLEREAAAADRLASAIAGRVGTEDPHYIVGIGRPRVAWSEASASFLEACAALSARLAGPPGMVCRYTSPGETGIGGTDALADGKEQARRAVVSGEPDQADASAKAYLDLLRAAVLPPARVRHEIEALFSSIRDALGDRGVSASAVARDLQLDYDLAVRGLRTSEEVRAFLRRLAAYSGTILAGRAVPTAEWKVRDFKDYVARHYGERDLSVQTIASSLSISASYLSKLVKKHLDRSVVDYLVDYRMERAKELLAASDLLTYQVAEATGYPDAQYFSTVFKRQIGVTPTDYRAQRRRTGSSR